MSEKMDRKNFMLALPAALTALVLHKPEEEPEEYWTVIEGTERIHGCIFKNNVIINYNKPGGVFSNNLIHNDVPRKRPFLRINSTFNGKLKAHPRAAEIERKL